ncbi:LysR family transcriptional regulator [Siccirubricoccus deserti]
MGGIRHFDLRRLDLNLLIAFDALATERSVTRAAERLGLGQPAVSHALGRLRGLLGDPLFVPTPRGLVPTARARALAGRVRAVLEGRRRRCSTGPPASIRVPGRVSSALACRTRWRCYSCRSCSHVWRRRRRGCG